jgi:DsbC/DsbD-like thiol-disulfide interchange protein
VAAAALASIATNAATAAEPVIASPWVEKTSTRLRLLAGSDRQLKAGRVRTAGVEIELAPGWKTYWRMPGDAGIPPAVEWAKSRNVAAVELKLPAPVRIEDRAGLTIGYDAPVTFPLIVTPVDPKAPVHLAIDVALGVCKDICVPIEAALSIDLPATLGPEREAPAITAAYARVPRHLGQVTNGVPLGSFPALLKIDGDFTPGTGRITVNARGASDAYVEAPDGLFVPVPKRTAGDADAKSTVFEVDLANSPDVEFLAGKTLRVTLVGPSGAIEVDWVAR